MTGSDHEGRATRTAIVVGLRVLTAATLVVDAIIHFQQAADKQLAEPGGIGEGNIFRIQAAVAILSAVYVLLRGSRLSFVIAFLVAGSAAVAVVLYRFVDIGGFGPIPSMYEPLWTNAKTLSAIPEAVGALSALVAIAVLSRTARRDSELAAGT